MTTIRGCSVCVRVAPGRRGPRGVCPQLSAVPAPGLGQAVELLVGSGEASRAPRSSLRPRSSAVDKASESASVATYPRDGPVEAVAAGCRMLPSAQTGAACSPRRTTS